MFGTTFLPDSPIIEKFKSEVKARIPFSQLGKESVFVLDVLDIFVNAAKEQINELEKDELQDCLDAIVSCPFWSDIEQIKDAAKNYTADQTAGKIDLWIEQQERWEAAATAITAKLDANYTKLNEPKTEETDEEFDFAEMFDDELETNEESDDDEFDFDEMFDEIHSLTESLNL